MNTDVEQIYYKDLSKAKQNKILQRIEDNLFWYSDVYTSSIPFLVFKILGATTIFVGYVFLSSPTKGTPVFSFDQTATLVGIIILIGLSYGLHRYAKVLFLQKHKETSLTIYLRPHDNNSKPD